jgi:hypothetical protein
MGELSNSSRDRKSSPSFDAVADKVGGDVASKVFTI